MPTEINLRAMYDADAAASGGGDSGGGGEGGAQAAAEALARGAATDALVPWWRLLWSPPQQPLTILEVTCRLKHFGFARY